LTSLKRAAAGDEDALNVLFSKHADRLKRMVRLRLHPRVRRRVSESDVIQEANLEAARHLGEYARDPRLPTYLWLRELTSLKLAELHRRHLDIEMRAVGREISLHSGPLPQASSVSLAAQLLGGLTSPSEAAIKAEMRVQLQEALEALEPLDREVLALRHFEQLTNSEAAQILAISESGASSRYLRAIKRLRGVLTGVPGFFDH
jgi:RNA polymerase sigma-70 factor (ECF subfamily)